jgi:hypothetical protein
MIIFSTLASLGSSRGRKNGGCRRRTLAATRLQREADPRGSVGKPASDFENREEPMCAGRFNGSHKSVILGAFRLRQQRLPTVRRLGVLAPAHNFFALRPALGDKDRPE